MRGIQPRQLPLSKPSSLQNLLYSSTALRNQPFFSCSLILPPFLIFVQFPNVIILTHFSYYRVSVL